MLRYFIIPFVLASFSPGDILRAATEPHAVPAPPANAISVPGPRSIDQELDRLTKELELTQSQRKTIEPILLQHRDNIQALLDNNPTLSREALRPQIRAISETIHHEIEALLSGHQQQLAKAMQKRMHHGDEGEPAPPAQPSPSGPSAANTIWTTEDLERLSSIPGLVSIVGQSAEEEAVQDNEAPEPQSVTEDREWFAEQADELNSRLASEQADLRDQIQALEDARELNLTSVGINLDELDLGDTPDATIDILQSQVRETQSELDALEELARHNDIEPGVLRGEWQGESADTEVAAPEQSQSDASGRGGDL